MSAHLWQDVTNKGMYRSEYTCTCGFQVITDGHSDAVLSAPDALEQHRHQTRLRVELARVTA